MATIEQIQQGIQLADAYSFELTDTFFASQIKQCGDCCIADRIEKIIWLTSSLQHRIEYNILNEETDSIYECLLETIMDYSGMSLPVDPNALMPGVIIEVPSGNAPEPLRITYPDMNPLTPILGTEYNNALWAGWNPFLQIDNGPNLILGTDYVLLENGGFFLVPAGNVPQIFDGQSIWAVNYAPQEFVPPVITVQPISQEVVDGGVLTLEIIATGADRYQWYKDGLPLTGENSSTLIIDPFVGANVGNYNCMAYNNLGGYVFSEEATVTLADIPPAGKVLLGNSSSFAVDYNDNFSGLTSLPSGESYSKDPIVDDQTFYVGLTTDGTYVSYQRYNSDGSPDGAPIVVTRPSGTGLEIGNMSILKGHLFTVADIVAPNAPTNGIVGNNPPTFTFTPAVI